MPSAEEIRSSQRAAWDGLSAAWERWDPIIVAHLAPITSAMVERLQLRDDALHLDIAAGTGEPGLTIAPLLPHGRVVLTDLSADMLEVAKRRAAARGIDNVDTEVCSADDLPFDDASFDSITVRLGYMFFPDGATVTAELARVLRPGGRLCSAVWVRPDANPWTSIALQAIATEVELPPADPDRPNMYRCAAPGCIGALYEAAGLTDVAEWDVDVELVTASPEEYWDMISEHVSLAAAALRQVDAPTRERMKATAIADVAPYVRDGQVRVPGAARCIVGTKPAAP
jgi:SAM-dependent methyltransferase